MDILTKVLGTNSNRLQGYIICFNLKKAKGDLFVDVEVLSNSEPADSPTVGAVVGELALVSMGLSNHGQLWVPNLMQPSMYC